MPIGLWATLPGTRVAPSAGEIANGFIPNTPSSPLVLNYKIGELSDYAAQNEIAFAAQHDPVTGVHTNITATDLIVTGGDFRVNAGGDITVQSIVTNGGKFSVSNNGAIVGADGDFQVSDAGFVRATLITVDGNVRAENYLFASSYTVEDRLIVRRFFIRQGISFGSGSINSSNGVETLHLGTVEDGRLIFEVPLESDINVIKLYKLDENNQTAWDLQYYDYDNAVWADVDGGPVDGVVNDIGDQKIITINLPDTNTPNFVGQGVHISSNQNLLSIKLENLGANDIDILCYEVQYYVSNVVQALQQ